MKLHDLSQPSDGDRKIPKRKRKPPDVQKQRLQLKEARRELNHLRHIGVLPGIDRLRQLDQRVVEVLDQIEPFTAKGTLNPDFVTGTDLLLRISASRAPYETPRLASLTVDDQRGQVQDGKAEYATIWELRARMVKKGLPVDHLIERRLQIEHDEDEVVEVSDGAS